MSDVSSDLVNASKISKFDIGKISLRILKQSKIGVMKKCFICNVSDYRRVSEKENKMSEYCEYMWCDPARGRSSLVRSIYEEGGRFDKRDKKLAIKTVRSILRQMPDVGKNCTK